MGSEITRPRRSSSSSSLEQQPPIAGVERDAVEVFRNLTDEKPQLKHASVLVRRK